MLQRRWLLLLCVLFTLTLTGATAGADPEGSTLAILDASGNETDSFLVGDTVYFRVHDALANLSPNVDTTQVEVLAIVRNWAEYQIVNLTETGEDTGVFEGSVPTVSGIDPIQHDGVVGSSRETSSTPGTKTPTGRPSLITIRPRPCRTSP